jgi:hypothetical protein
MIGRVLAGWSCSNAAVADHQTEKAGIPDRRVELLVRPSLPSVVIRRDPD